MAPQISASGSGIAIQVNGKLLLFYLLTTKYLEGVQARQYARLKIRDITEEISFDSFELCSGHRHLTNKVSMVRAYGNYKSIRRSGFNRI